MNIKCIKTFKCNTSACTQRHFFVNYKLLKHLFRFFVVNSQKTKAGGSEKTPVGPGQQKLDSFGKGIQQICEIGEIQYSIPYI